MREYFQVVAYDESGEGDVVGTYRTFDEAEDCYFKCVEGDDKSAPCEYIIESTSVAE